MTKWLKFEYDIPGWAVLSIENMNEFIISCLLKETSFKEVQKLAENYLPVASSMNHYSNELHNFIEQVKNKCIF